MRAVESEVWLTRGRAGFRPRKRDCGSGLDPQHALDHDVHEYSQ
jgi:hypothetical protein